MPVRRGDSRTVARLHSFEGERGIQASPEKFRLDPCESATRNVEGVFYFQCRRLFPHRITSDLVLNLSDQNPICRAAKRGANPLLIYLLVLPAALGSELYLPKCLAKAVSVSASSSGEYRIRETNMQSIKPLWRTDFLERRARKIKGKIEKRVHQQESMPLQRMNRRKLKGLNFARQEMNATTGGVL